MTKKLTIAFIAPMIEELNELLAQFPKESISQTVEKKVEITIIDYKNIQVIAALSGVGKVNAAYTATILFMKYNPDVLINCGVAGGFEKSQKVLDFVIGTKFVYTDVDITFLGLEMGQLIKEPPYFPASDRLIEKIKSMESNFDVKFHYGIIGSADQFINKDHQVEFIQKHFPDVICVEMEGAAIAHVAHKFEIPILAIRSLSDIAVKKEDNSLEYLEFLEKAAQLSAKLCLMLIESLSSDCQQA
ncbi:5'-methylthioadenosine/S-adenosylhomocysteine nucleosidase [Tritrichomonas foetus]|uniref:adenosylhomocysteine nucleosidase n=1 Tax=Tritrichomonas foetus TaxID=1144522 RepID=A0A1J4J554_9EUKA|nr:5'-methylthioadenosine/S-adenosylhomocysteine nucleosidase [Tritrichomonas foetus]|eukprot:OHS93825.1 5'-methylthioadenosine/S-adenosylhomocysteine nucleosidase [Tritrichomonas foetus]